MEEASPVGTGSASNAAIEEKADVGAGSTSNVTMPAGDDKQLSNSGIPLISQNSSDSKDGDTAQESADNSSGNNVGPLPPIDSNFNSPATDRIIDPLSDTFEIGPPATETEPDEVTVNGTKYGVELQYTAPLGASIPPVAFGAATIGLVGSIIKGKIGTAYLYLHKFNNFLVSLSCITGEFFSF